MDAKYIIEHLEEATLPTYVQITEDILVKYFDMEEYRYEVIFNGEAETAQLLVFKDGKPVYKEEKEADGNNELKLFKDLEDLFWNKDIRDELQSAILIRDKLQGAISPLGLKLDMKIVNKED